MSNVMIHDGGGGPSNASRANSASFDDIEAALVNCGKPARRPSDRTGPSTTTRIL